MRGPEIFEFILKNDAHVVEALLYYLVRGCLFGISLGYLGEIVLGEMRVGGTSSGGGVDRGLVGGIIGFGCRFCIGVGI